MRRTLACCTLGLLMLLSAAQIYSDVPRPRPSPAPTPGKAIFHTSLTVLPDKNISEARLQISQDSLNNLRAAMANAATNQSMLQRISNSSSRTLLAGFFLFLSISFGGVWLARSGQNRSQKAVPLVILGIALVGVTAIITRANAGPPSPMTWQRLALALKEGRGTGAGVDIEIVQDGYGIKLLLPSTDKKVNGEE